MLFRSAQFAGSERLGFAAGAPKPDGTVTVVGKGYETWVLVRDVIDLPKELDKLAKTLTKTKQYVQSVENKLSNQAFVNSAPADIVEGERKKLSEAQDSIRRLMAYQKELQG